MMESPMIWRLRLLRTAVASVLAASTMVAAAVEQASAYCRNGFSPWADPTQELWVWNDIPDAWNAAISASRHAWNNIDPELIYWVPRYDVSAYGSFTLVKGDFSDHGFGNSPGLAFNNLSSQPHETSLVWMNTEYTWNLTGVMNQAQKKADVRTVLTHEIGHSSGLAHPYPDCDVPFTIGEQQSVMNSNWAKKWSTNGDDHNGILNAY